VHHGNELVRCEIFRSEQDSGWLTSCRFRAPVPQHDERQ
jgi:hypothetical protein